MYSLCCVGYLIPKERRGEIEAMVMGIREAAGGLAVTTKRTKKAADGKAASSTGGCPANDDTAVAKAMAMFS